MQSSEGKTESLLCERSRVLSELREEMEAGRLSRTLCCSWRLSSFFSFPMSSGSIAGSADTQTHEAVSSIRRKAQEVRTSMQGKNATTSRHIITRADIIHYLSGCSVYDFSAQKIETKIQLVSVSN